MTIVSACLLTLLACDDPDQEQSATVTVDAMPTGRQKEKVAPAKFINEEFPQKPDSDHPETVIRVAYNGAEVSLDTLWGSPQPIGRSDFSQHRIPENASEACYVFWAGSGSYYYLAPSNDGYAVYKGQYEDEPGQGHNWKLVKELR